MNRKRISAVGAVLALGVAALVLTGGAVGKPSAKSAARTLPSSSCGPVFYKGSGSPALPDRERPAAPGRGSCAAHRDAAGDPVRARQAVQVQGRQVHGRLPGLRRLDGADGGVGLRRSARRTRARTRPTRASSAVLGTFNSGCAKLDRPDPQPGTGRAGRDAQRREHGRRADALRSRGTTRASRGSTTRPGSGTTLASRPADDYQGPAARRPAQAARTGQVRLRHPRQPDVRQGRCERVQAEGRRRSASRCSASSRGIAKATSYEATRPADRGHGARTRSTSAASSATTA